MMRFLWVRTETALPALAEHGEGTVEIDFVSPETGDDVLPTLGFTAIMLQPGVEAAPPRRSTSAVWHVIGGRGRSVIDDVEISWEAKDTFSAPVFARVSHEAADGPAFLIQAHDRPLQRRLGYYEERSRS